VNVATIEMTTLVLDGGALLVEWRYLNEGSDMTELRVERVYREHATLADRFWDRSLAEFVTELTRIPALSTTGADWRTESFRDTAFVTGVDVTYRVQGLGGNGSATTSASSTINIPGTFLNPVFGDATDVVLKLDWEDVPSGVVGFQVLRTAPGGKPELVFASNDPALRTYGDPIQIGKDNYTYQLVTLFEGGGTMHSVPRRGGLFEIIRSDDPIRPAKQGERLILAIRDILGSGTFTKARLHVGPSEIYGSLVTGSRGPSEIITVNGGDYDARTLSGSFALEETQQTDDQFRPHAFYIAGLNANNSEVYLEARFDTGWELQVTKRWPAAGTRTALAHLGGRHLLLSAGDVLRLLSDSLKVEQQVILADGQPLDIEYQNGSIWLAYEDRLLKSNPTEDLAGIMNWETLPVTGISIQAISRFREDMLVLDGVNRRVHLVGGDGSVRLTWETVGTNPLAADISGGTSGQLVGQTDGEFVVHLITPDGWEKLATTL